MSKEFSSFQKPTPWSANQKIGFFHLKYEKVNFELGFYIPPEFSLRIFPPGFPES